MMLVKPGKPGSERLRDALRKIVQEHLTPKACFER
jgi:hypothetical protein